jgi:hypothetical protein
MLFAWRYLRSRPKVAGTRFACCVLLSHKVEAIKGIVRISIVSVLAGVGCSMISDTHLRRTEWAMTQTRREVACITRLVGQPCRRFWHGSDLEVERRSNLTFVALVAPTTVTQRRVRLLFHVAYTSRSVLVHSRFWDCTERKDQRYSHRKRFCVFRAAITEVQGGRCDRPFIFNWPAVVSRFGLKNQPISDTRLGRTKWAMTAGGAGVHVCFASVCVWSSYVSFASNIWISLLISLFSRIDESRPTDPILNNTRHSTLDLIPAPSLLPTSPLQRNSYHSANCVQESVFAA